MHMQRTKSCRILTLPTQIVLQALLFVCVLSLRDAMKQTLQLLPLPKHNVACVWLVAMVQIGFALLVLLTLTWLDWIDPDRFIAHPHQ